MQIQLCEDNGLICEGGIPTLVVLLVKFDDGKTRRIPYEAEKTIAALYQDLRAIEPIISDAPQVTADAHPFESLELAKAKASIAVETVHKAIEEAYKAPSTAVKHDRSHVIEKEDIVTLVKLNTDVRDNNFSGSLSPLVVGMEYRVIAVLGQTIPTPDGKGVKKIVQGYEVLDDSASTKERMVVLPDEVQLRSKRISNIIPKVSAVEEVLECPSCGSKNSLTLKDDLFVGVCDNCKIDLVIARIVQKCGTPKCGKDVSCFDVGGKYEGTCGHCKAKIEVPYA